ncbi:EamA family transporter RarD [Luedemannella helvata]|uniref:EamA family transporter RarD n=1 Tax=Luedemannella helvata TaxID=349315 RepID=A0ABN2JRC3_9ACTN
MSQERRGYVFAVAAYLSWGFFPFYFKYLRPSGPAEILAQRVLWSFLFMVAVVSVARGWPSVWRLRHDRRRFGLALAAGALIGVNWGVYIYGVNADRVVETSLGYFITPLVTVALGVAVLKERLRRAQWAALSIGLVAVIVLTLDYGHVPYIALTLTASFALYGLVKKHLAVPATDGLLLESAVLAPPALVYVAVLMANGESTFGHVSVGHTTLMVLAGAITAIPLLMFAAAANRITLSTIGLLQYLAPILQFGIGVLIFKEPMPPARLAGFALVWLALIVFTWDGIRYMHARTRSNRPSAVPLKAPAA